MHFIIFNYNLSQLIGFVIKKILIELVSCGFNFKSIFCQQLKLIEKYQAHAYPQHYRIIKTWNLIVVSIILASSLQLL